MNIDDYERYEPLSRYSTDNTAILFNMNDLKIDELKKIQNAWDKPIYRADLWDSNEKIGFDENRRMIASLYDYYSELNKLIQSKEFIANSIYGIPPLALEDPDDALCHLISDEVKTELEKTVAVLGKYLSETDDYESTFDEKNY